MSRRIDSIQSLRAIAFLAVFMSHSRLFGLGFLGAWGVSIFFVLSGFLMVYSYYPKIDYAFPPAHRFAWQKIRKLYPIHILMTVACILYTILNEGKISANLPIVTLLHTLLLQIWIPNSAFYETLNGVAWYLCVCAFTYFCFPLILNVLRKVRNKREVILIMGGVRHSRYWFLSLRIALVLRAKPGFSRCNGSPIIFLSPAWPISL